MGYASKVLKILATSCQDDSWLTCSIRAAGRWWTRAITTAHQQGDKGAASSIRVWITPIPLLAAVFLECGSERWKLAAG